MPLSRRDLLRSAALGAAGLTFGRFALPNSLTPAADARERFIAPLPQPQVLTAPDITLRAAEADVAILPGAPTRMWTFNGTFPGPTIRRPAGETTRVTVVHDLPAAVDTLTIHHHGSHSASEHDGQPERHVIAPGTSRTYVYDHVEDGEPERAAMQWYHDHSHHRTSRNSWMGLAGLFILDDAVEAALPLPRGRFEIPLFLTDRTFDANNQLVTTLFNTPPANREVAGTTFLVNGVPFPYTEVEPRRYRLRFHNGSGFRLYNLSLLAGSAPVPMTQIGTESGLLPRTVDRSTILLGPAERADVVVDFSGFAGKTVTLDSVNRNQVPATDPAATPGGMLQFRVGTAVTQADAGAVPQQLRNLPAWVSQAKLTPDRVWSFGRGIDTATMSEAHTINGRAFDHSRIDAQVDLASVETWMLLNTTPRTHYIHIHDVDWVVLQRNGQAPPAWESGLKETFRLDSGEFVLVAAKFSDHLGDYMIHCHMLDHEDGGMMAAWQVVAPGGGAATTLTPAEHGRVERVLSAMRTRPGQPAPMGLLGELATQRVDVSSAGGGVPYLCEL